MPGHVFATLPEEICVGKTASIRDLGQVDMAGLREPVLQLPLDHWDRPEDFGANYNKGGAIQQGSHIIFRFSDRRGTPYRYTELPIWKEWAARLLPVMEEAVRPFGYEAHFFPRVMLAKLPPRAFIPPHIDGDSRGFVPHKIHVPILTNPKAIFFCGNEKHNFEVGRAYEVNNGVRHSVVNGGDTDRIHLLFEYLDWNAQPF